MITRTGLGMNLGGGVGLWIRNDIDFDIIPARTEERHCEMQSIVISDLKICIINVYRPLGDIGIFFNTLESNLEEICSKFPTHTIIMVGDFNIDLAKSSMNTNTLIETTLGFQLIQQVTLPTRVTSNSSTLIDHVYTKSKRTLKTDVVLTTISDHYATLTSFNDLLVKRKDIKVTKRWFVKDTYDKLATILGATDWTEMSEMSCDQAATHLEMKITEALDIVAPIETKLVKTRIENQWTTLGIKTSLFMAMKLYKKFKRSKNSIHGAEYKHYKKILSKVIRKSKDLYYTSIINIAETDTRKLWGIMNELVDRKQCKHRIPNRFFVDGVSIRHKKPIANAFNNYFTSIGKAMADSLPKVDGFEDHLGLICKYKMGLKPLEKEDVELLMKNQQPKMSCGIDTINNKVVKHCHKELAEPMTMVINKSIMEHKPGQIKSAE